MLLSVFGGPAGALPTGHPVGQAPELRQSCPDGGPLFTLWVGVEGTSRYCCTETLGEQGEAAPSRVGACCPLRPPGSEEEGTQDEGEKLRPLPEALSPHLHFPSPLHPLHCLQLSDSWAPESQEGAVLPGAQALRWMLPCPECADNERADNGRARPPREAALISPAEAPSSSS